MATSLTQNREEYLTALVEEMQALNVPITAEGLWRWQPVRWLSEKSCAEWVEHLENETVGAAELEASIKAARDALYSLAETTLSAEQMAKRSHEALLAHKQAVMDAFANIHPLVQELAAYARAIDQFLS